MQIDELSKAVREKYGNDAAKAIREDWTLADEAAFQKEIELLFEKEKKLEQSEKASLFNGEEKCSCCNKLKVYFKIKDDVNVIKYGCCNSCYIKYIEDREERWHKGWRPNLHEETKIGKQDQKGQ
jgi:hypothetical protein